MWSLGCVFFEMMQVAYPAMHILQTGVIQPVLFPGESCFPVTSVEAANTDHMSISPNDQLRVILRQIDSLSEYDLAFIENKQSKFFVQLFEKVDAEQKAHYSKRLEYLPKGMKELLSNMLQFNPYLRYSARECLEM